MRAKPSECRKQAGAGREANTSKASFPERRLFYLNRHRHCEEGALPDEAISTCVWGLLRAKSALAMTIHRGLQ